MTLLEFLRKSNASGDVVAWLQKAYAAADTALDLGAFASVFQTFGEKVIAAEVVSIFNDKYFGQWLMLNVPFRAAKDLLDVKVMDCVPPRYQMFACPEAPPRGQNGHEGSHDANDRWDQQGGGQQCPRCDLAQHQQSSGYCQWWQQGKAATQHLRQDCPRCGKSVAAGNWPTFRNLTFHQIGSAK